MSINNTVGSEKS